MDGLLGSMAAWNREIEEFKFRLLEAAPWVRESWRFGSGESVDPRELWRPFRAEAHTTFSQKFSHAP